MKGSIQIRSALVETLELDLIGPRNDHSFAHELLPQSPQRWYLTGYLIPRSADEQSRRAGDEELDLEVATGTSGDDNEEGEQQAQVSHLPSSMGLSVLVGPETGELSATIRWGDYTGEVEGENGEEFDPAEVDQAHEEEMAKAVEEPLPEESPADNAKKKWFRRGYRRDPREELCRVELDGGDGLKELPVPNSRGIKLVVSWRSLPQYADSELPAGTKTVSAFVVNDRLNSGERTSYGDIVFQVELELFAEKGFHGRPDLRGAAFQDESDPDELIADLHYRDILEYAVGHGVATIAEEDANGCKTVRTTWIPSAEIPRVDHADKETIGEVELAMERLGEISDLSDARNCLGGLVASYQMWISSQAAGLSTQLSAKQQSTAQDLINGAKVAAGRVEEGIEALGDPECLEAFRIANRAMARSARQRFAVQQGKKPHEVEPPRWRAFQLAFILMNIRGLFDPLHIERRVVDLLFFPTGGGKTEAYLGLAAFTVILRRLQNPGIGSAGVSIIMRYTLRLLTLDQLSRAAALMCALELERTIHKSLGEWPFEIGLWVGSAATPNRMGKAKDDSPGKNDTAYTKLTKYRNNPRKNPAPIPMEECPWCGSRFEPDCFHLEPPGSIEPRDLRVSCINMHCEFSAANHDARLPILGVDEPIYRRLPCFLIATVDKFAALPWIGRTGGLFGNVDRFDSHGFYGACDPGKGTALPEGRLLPPDLIIQDELHLISGPLGTVAGIYETAIEELCKRDMGDGKQRLPKIVASTATVRRADHQIRALFGREQTAIFPPPGPNRDDSFFARTIPSTAENPGRLYLGVAAQGRSMKVVLLRSALALLARAEKLHLENGGKTSDNPCDPYMTMLSYFNSLRELGGSRRIVEDEIYLQVQSRWKRKRLDPDDQQFCYRYIKRPVELTSRVSTDDVANAKRRLAADFSREEHVDVALATNMISVGLDIVRLGLMVVFGQPKTTSEYIQATSRVGRDRNKPGLVLALLNVHKPRDRSHYERFGIYHRTFYRSVEATSITPFSPRALDRALAGALVGLCRHHLSSMEAPTKAGEVQSHLPELQKLVRVFSRRAKIHDVEKSMTKEGDDLAAHVDGLVQNLLAKWAKIAAQCASEGGALTYQKYEGSRQGDALIRDFLDAELVTKPALYRSFRANRSMRDVEPAVDIIPTKSSIRTNQ